MPKLGHRVFTYLCTSVPLISEISAQTMLLAKPQPSQCEIFNHLTWQYQPAHTLPTVIQIEEDHKDLPSR